MNKVHMMMIITGKIIRNPTFLSPAVLREVFIKRGKT
jgi:hypothetical protein